MSNEYQEGKCIRWVDGGASGICNQPVMGSSKWCSEHSTPKDVGFTAPQFFAAMAAGANSNGEDAERLPNDAYAAQGGKAAVNELLAMKMQQVSQLSKKIAYIRDLVGGHAVREADRTLEEYDGWLEGKYFRLGQAEGERRMALWVLDILNKAAVYDD